MHSKKASFIPYAIYYQGVIRLMYVCMSFAIKSVTQNKKIRISHSLILNY